MYFYDFFNFFQKSVIIRIFWQTVIENRKNKENRKIAIFPDGDSKSAALSYPCIPPVSPSHPYTPCSPFQRGGLLPNATASRFKMVSTTANDKTAYHLKVIFVNADETTAVIPSYTTSRTAIFIFFVTPAISQPLPVSLITPSVNPESVPQPYCFVVPLYTPTS